MMGHEGYNSKFEADFEAKVNLRMEAMRGIPLSNLRIGNESPVEDAAIRRLIREKSRLVEGDVDKVVRISAAKEGEKSLSEVASNIKDNLDGSGSQEDPYTIGEFDDNREFYLGIYAVVESMNSGKSVFVELSGVVLEVNNVDFTYISGEPDRVEKVMRKLMSPLIPYIKQIKD